MTTRDDTAEAPSWKSPWDYCCFMCAQRHVKRALDAMAGMDYAAAVKHIRAAARWERKRP